MSPYPSPKNLPSQRQRTAPGEIDFKALPAPAFLFDEGLLVGNLEYLKDLAERLDVNILLAQKAYSLYQSYPLMSQYLAGTTASGLYEAKLGHEHFPGEVHVYKPAYLPGELAELFGFVDHVSLNSVAEWERALAVRADFLVRGEPVPSLGLRVNPYYSEVATALYNPAGPHSRLGLPPTAFRDYFGEPKDLPAELTGLHFHALCEENADALEGVLMQFLKDFRDYLPQLRWLNLGGGHHLCRGDYDVERLARLIGLLHERYPNLTLYMEPGEGVVIDTGYLVADVLDIVDNVSRTAILNTSAACHMPDVLEMPYRPRCFLFAGTGSEPPQEARGIDWPEEDDEEAQKAAVDALLASEPHLFRLAGPTCLAGDTIGHYAFERPLQRGDRLVFCDMALYAHVKTNTFNGMPLADLYWRDSKGQITPLRRFGYEDFKSRL